MNVTPNEYLERILERQTLDPNGQELADLKKRGEDVVALLNREFPDSDKAIRYAGSFEKETMIRDSYDLDIACHFANEDISAGDSLEDIYANVQKALKKEYLVQGKTSALRLKSNEQDSLDEDFHIDVVPGRYTGPERTDVFIHVSTREKSRLKTNLNVQVGQIRWSGCLDEIRLMKLWNVRTYLSLKTFVLELATIKALRDPDTPLGLSERVQWVWEYLRDNADTLTVEDPANPSGNDLSEYLTDQVREHIKKVAAATLKTLNDKDWDAVFGPTADPTKEQKVGAIISVTSRREVPARPWCDLE